MKLLRFALFLARFLLPAASFSTTPQEDYLNESVSRHDFDQQKWKSLTDGIDYSQKEKPKEQQQAPAARKETTEGMGTFLKFLIIAAGVGLLVFLFLKMATGDDLFRPRNKKLKPAAAEINLEKIEENLHEAELNDPIRKAVAAGDYALAIRLHYLAVLKELSLKKHIRWKRDKTNGEYLRELASSSFFKPFQELTLIFERVWYGKVALEREDYFNLESKFKTALAAVS
jgi:hypothetical protein